MIAEVATNLLGEIVEIHEWRDGHSGDRGYYSLRGRGHVRAVYVTDNELRVLVAHDLGYDSSSYDDRTKDGGFETYSLQHGRARVVERCVRCFAWDQKSSLATTYPDEGTEKTWEHKKGEGCKKVGHGG